MAPSLRVALLALLRVLLLQEPMAWQHQPHRLAGLARMLRQAASTPPVPSL
jgi:hypothetical protein